MVLVSYMRLQKENSVFTVVSGNGAIWLRDTCPLVQVREAECPLHCSSWQWIKILGWLMFFFCLLLVLLVQRGASSWDPVFQPSILSLLKVYSDSYLKKMPRVLLCKAELVLLSCWHTAGMQPWYTHYEQGDRYSLNDLCSLSSETLRSSKNIPTPICPNFESELVLLQEALKDGQV